MSTATHDPATHGRLDHGYDGPNATPEFDHTSSPADNIHVNRIAGDPSHPADPAFVERDDLGRKTPEQIEREIAATRGRMDTTIERLKTRLQPANLVDEALAAFGISPSDVDQSASETVRSLTRKTARAIKENPVPSALVAAAGLWKIFADDEHEHHERPEFEIAEPAGYRKTYDPGTGRMTYAPRVPAWSHHYAWDDDVHEKTWGEAASEKIEALKATLADTKRSAGDKLKSVSETLTSLSSVSQDELHDQWDGLREVNGSFVDARTGEPYSDDYGQEFRHLLAAHHARGGELPQDDEGWAEMAESTLAEIGQTLNDAGTTASEKLSAAAISFGNLMGGCWDSTCRYTSAAADKSAAAGRSTAAAIRSGAASAYGATARGANAAYDATARGASAVADGASAAGRAIADGASAAGSSIASGLSSAGSSIADGAAYAGDATTHAARRASRRTAVAAKKAWHKTGDAYDDYPLAMGAAAVGVGLLAGLILPRTRFEDRAYGEKSDQLKEQAKHVGEQAVEAGKHVAEATVEAAHAKAREEGIAPEQVKQKAESLAEQAKEAAAGLAETAKEKAKSVADEARLTAAVAAEDAAEAAKSAAKTAHEKAEQTPAETAAGSLRMKVEEVVATAAETAKDEAAKEAEKITS